ncbi:unnamed protein product, partial [Rotaria sordida]
MHTFLSTIGIGVETLQLGILLSVQIQSLSKRSNDSIQEIGNKLYQNVWIWLKARSKVDDDFQARHLLPPWLREATQNNAFLFTGILLHETTTNGKYTLDTSDTIVDIETVITKTGLTGVGPIGLQLVVTSLLKGLLIDEFGSPNTHSTAPGISKLPRGLTYMTFVVVSFNEEEEIPALVVSDERILNEKYWCTTGVKGFGRL